jgi:hypothetical protein
MLLRSAFAALVLASFASGAFAQAKSIQPQSGYVSPQQNPGGAMYDNLNIQARLWRQSMTSDSRSDVTPEQLHRARQAASLIKANRCEDAYNLALAEQDNRLALNIAVACKAQLRQ